jgi:hypothetical protein
MTKPYPRIVSSILNSRSAPQPATMKTPSGGTKFLLSVSISESGRKEGIRTEDRDQDQAD